MQAREKGKMQWADSVDQTNMQGFGKTTPLGLVPGRVVACSMRHARFSQEVMLPITTLFRCRVFLYLCVFMSVQRMAYCCSDMAYC